MLEGGSAAADWAAAGSAAEGSAAREAEEGSAAREAVGSAAVGSEELVGSAEAVQVKAGSTAR